MAITEKPEEVHQEAEANAPEVTDLDKHVVVDTVHTDEAMKVLANYNGDQAWDEIEEKRLRRKIDRRLLPIMCITYGECQVLSISAIRIIHSGQNTDGKGQLCSTMTRR